jgi:hypothetical protein
LKQYDFNGDLAVNFGTPPKRLAALNLNNLENLKKMLKDNAVAVTPDEDPRNVYQALIYAYGAKLRNPTAGEQAARKDLEEVYAELRTERGGQVAQNQQAAQAAQANEAAKNALPNRGNNIAAGTYSNSTNALLTNPRPVRGVVMTGREMLERLAVGKEISYGEPIMDPKTGQWFHNEEGHYAILDDGEQVRIPKDLYEKFSVAGFTPAPPPTLPAPVDVTQLPPATPQTPAAASKIAENLLSAESLQDLEGEINVLGDSMSKKDAINRFGIAKQEADGKYFIALDSGDSIEVPKDVYDNFYANPADVAFAPDGGGGAGRPARTTGQGKISPDTMAEIFDRYALMAEYRKAIAQGRMSVPLEYSTGGVSNRYNASMAEVLEALKLTGFTDEEINEQ